MTEGGVSGGEEARREYTERLTEADLEAFAGKLEEWSINLPVKERVLLRLVLARAQRSTQDLSSGEGITLPGVVETTTSVLRPLLQGTTARVRGWVEAGDPWVQSVK